MKVTGTNGKGSVCAMLEACLLRDGHRVGLFTSPHLSSPTERFRINGQDVTEAMLEAHAREIGDEIAAGIAERGEAWRPSFFEMLVLLSIRLFHAANIDIAIYEAGVGGYNDATSLLPGIVSAITGVALDHQDRLGNTVEEIAADKAGIASEGADLVVGAGVSRGAVRVIEADAARRGVNLHMATSQDIRVLSQAMSGSLVELTILGRALRFGLPLIGAYQIQNLATATLVMKLLHHNRIVRDVECIQGVEATRWAGRMELRRGSPSFLLDVAHNEQGVSALIEALDQLIPYERRVVLYGASADKEYAACLRHVPRIAPIIHVVEGFYRAASTAALAKNLGGSRVVAEHANVEDALNTLAPADAARAVSPEEAPGSVVVITGSVFLVGAARDVLSRRALEAK